MDTIYKRKDQKVKLINLSELDGIKLEEYTDWKKRVIEVMQT